MAKTHNALRRSLCAPLCLEPRMLFDAAAVATAASTVQQTEHSNTNADAAHDATQQADHANASMAVAGTAQQAHIGGDSTQLDYKGKTDGWNSDVYTDVLEGTRDTAASADGKFVYTVGIPSSGASSVNVYSRADDGTLTRVQSLFDANRAGGISGLEGAERVVFSADQKSVYVIGSIDNAVTVFSRDETSGELTRVGAVTGADLHVDRISDVAASNGHVYITADNSLLVFSQNNGALTLEHTYRSSDAGLGGLEAANRLLLSSDGQSLYVATSGGTGMLTAFGVGSDGMLNLLNSVSVGSGQHNVQAMILSPDGKTLYAIDNGTPGSLEAITINGDGSMTRLAGYSLSTTGTDLSIAADGSAVFMVGESGIKVYQRASDGSLNFVGDVTSGNDDGPDFSQLTSASLSSDGRQLYVSGRIGFGSTLMTLDVSLTDAAYTEGHDAVPMLPSGHLSSPVLDSNDYGGATLTVARKDGAVADDTYSLIAGHDLLLSGNQIMKNGVAIATVDSTGGTLTISMLANSTQADAQHILQQISYRNSSRDPEHAGSSPVFAMQFDDGRGNQASVDVTVKLTGINDPATLASTVLNPTVQENGDYAKLFKDTRIDTIEEGQLIWQVGLTIDGAGANERIMVNGNVIRLTNTNGTASLPNGDQYMVRVVSGQAIVTLYMQKTAAQAAALIDSIAYNNVGNGLSGTRQITLSIKENNYSGSAPVTTLSQTAIVTLAPASSPNTAPDLSAATPSQPYTERGAPIALAPDAVLTDAQMDGLNGGSGNYDGAVLTVALGAGAGAQDKLGFSAGNGLVLEGTALKKDGVTIATISNADGVMTIRFTQDNGVIPSTADVRNTLHQITYASDNHAPAAHVAVSVTLADRTLSSSALALDIAVTQINDAPVVTLDPLAALGDAANRGDLASVAGLSNVNAVLLSGDGAYAYVADSRGAIALFSRDAASGTLTYVSTLAAGSADLTSIEAMKLSTDGKSLYAVGNDNQALAIFSRDSHGVLQHLATLTQDSSNDWTLSNIKDLALSADGKSAYVLGNTGIQIYGRDETTGALTYVSSIAGAWSPPYLWLPASMSMVGETIFIGAGFSGKSLMAYQRGTDGNLTLLGYLQGGQSDAQGNTVSYNTMQHMAASPDGQYVFLGGGDSVQLLRFDAASGKFTFIGKVASAGSDINDMRMAADGKTLYVSEINGTLTRYAVNGVQLIRGDRLQGAQAAALAQVRQIAISADGGILVAGDGLSVLQTVAKPAPVVKAGGAAINFTSALQLSDAELDAADNYQGALLHISRQGQAFAGDVFGLRDGNGFTLVGDTVFKNGIELARLSNADGTLTLRFTGAVSKTDASAIVHQLTYASTDNSAGIVSLNVTFNDGTADSLSQLLQVSVKVNAAPAAGGTAPDLQAVAGQRFTHTLPATLFSDADGDALTWRVVDLPASLSFDQLTRTLSGTPAIAGTITLTLTATDPDGASASRQITLRVSEAPVIPPAVVTTPVVDDVTPNINASAPAPAASGQANPGSPLSSLAPSPVAQMLRTGAASLEIARAWDGDRRAFIGASTDARTTQDFLDTLRERERTDAMNPPVFSSLLGDGRSTPLVAPASGEQQALSRTVESVRGQWQADPAGNRQVYMLPAGLFASRTALKSIQLQGVDNRALPQDVRLDVETGAIIAGARHGQSVLRLQLEVQDVDGRTLRIPVTIERAAATSSPANEPVIQQQSWNGMPALSQQVRTQTSFDLIDQVRELLAALAHGTPPPTMPMVSDQAGAAPLHITSNNTES